MKNEDYWRDYYLKAERQPPSDFAVWAKPRIRGSLVWDIGCGDGRDTGYLTAVGVDPFSPPPHAPAKFEDFAKEHECSPSDTVYARWFLHSVESEVEDQLLDWTKGQLLVEARVKGDNTDDTHWRRPVDPDHFWRKLHSVGYDVLYFSVRHGYSKVGDDDPYLLRVDAQRAA